MKQVNNPHALYKYLNAIAEHFNQRLYARALPSPLFTFKRSMGTLAYFTTNKWQQTNGLPVGEIVLNPALFGEYSWVSLMKAIAQQQCHMWQHLYGEPSRPGYHNTQWAEKMKEIGLMPTATGKPGGRATGQRIFLYIVPDGKFIRACVELIDGPLRLPISAKWHLSTTQDDNELPINLPVKTRNHLMKTVGRWSDDDLLIEQEELKAKKQKLKYICPTCNVSVWGKSGLNLLCQSCHNSLREVPPLVRRRTENQTTAAH